jgi:hypothetical protein
MSDSNESKPVMLSYPVWQANVVMFLMAILGLVTVGVVILAQRATNGWGFLLLLVFGVPVLFSMWLVGLMLGRHLRKALADERGVTTRSAVGEERFLAWGDIASVRMNERRGELVLEGEPGQPTLGISTAHRNFGDFLSSLRSHVNWPSLVRAGAAETRSAIEEAQPPASLPLVVNLFRTEIWPFIRAILLGVFCFIVMFLMFLNSKDSWHGLGLGLGGLWMMCMVIWLTMLARLIYHNWYRFQLDSEGIELRALDRRRAINWKQLQSVEATISKSRTSPTYRLFLILRLDSGESIEIAVGNRAFALRDAIGATARAAGHELGGRVGADQSS